MFSHWKLDIWIWCSKWLHWTWKVKHVRATECECMDFLSFVSSTSMSVRRRTIGKKENNPCNRTQSAKFIIQIRQTIRIFYILRSRTETWNKGHTHTFSASGKYCSKCSNICGSSLSCTKRKCLPSGMISISTRRPKGKHRKMKHTWNMRSDFTIDGIVISAQTVE